MKKRFLTYIWIALALLVGCRPTPPPTEALPTPTPTPVPVDTPAYAIAAAYLDAWAARDYETMYGLCSTASRTSTPPEEFARIYQEIEDESTLFAVYPTLKAVLQEGPRARAAFKVQFDELGSVSSGRIQPSSLIRA